MLEALTFSQRKDVLDRLQVTGKADAARKYREYTGCSESEAERVIGEYLVSQTALTRKAMNHYYTTAVNKKDAVRRYFDPPVRKHATPSGALLAWAIVLFVLAVLVAAATVYFKQIPYGVLAASAGLILVGVILLIVRGKKYRAREAAFMRAYERETALVLTEPEVDDVCAAFVPKESLLGAALRRGGLSIVNIRTAPPVVFSHYCYEPIGGVAPRLKLGEDGKWRSTHYAFELIFFADAKTYRYTYRFGMLDDVRDDSLEPMSVHWQIVGK